MFKLIYTGKEYAIFVKNLNESESYPNKQEAESNKRITCALLNIAPENITIQETPKK